MNLSVVICTHNPREDYLRRTFDSLRKQTLSMDRWELLVVDNGSKQPLAGHWSLSWHPSARIVAEPKLGLTPARLRGILESSGEIIVFIDDDNVLAANYLEVALGIVLKHPNLGCIGAGTIEPEYEKVPAVELVPHLPSLALRTVSQTVWSNTPEDSNRPYGAGLIARRAVAEGFRQVVSDCKVRGFLGRKGNGLSSGEDDEFSWVACEMGMGKGLFPELKLLHLIAARRIDRDYLLRIAEGHGFSQALLAHLHGVKTYQLRTPSTWRDVVQSALRLRALTALEHGRTMWVNKQRTEMDLAIESAWARGAEKARGKLKELAVAEHAEDPMVSV